MPELPEVETVRRGLAPVMEGAHFVNIEARRPDLRRSLPEKFAARLEGQAVVALRRRAKYLLAELSSGEVLIMHLGMSGSFRVSHEKGAAAGQGGAAGEGGAKIPQGCFIIRDRRHKPTIMSYFICRTACASRSTIRAASA